MKYILEGIEPQKYFQYFEEISRIPRSSCQEKAISDYVMNFADEHGLKAVQDDWGNVVIWKGATPGFENRKTIMLQGHMDMVCVADEGVCHDFSKDPIELYVDGDWVKAKGTTLGADNGSAIAMMLMILDAEDVEHPAIQCIFTVQEEIGLLGASHLDGTLLEGSYLINLDGGGEENLLLSSAGASHQIYRMKKEMVPVESAEDKVAYDMILTGMTSGHSGGRIHECMGNAIKIMADILNDMDEEIGIEVSDYVGGLKMNAIAKTSEAIIVVKAGKTNQVDAFAKEMRENLRREYSDTDPDISFTLKQIPVPEMVYSKDTQKKILTFMDLMFDGTYKFMDKEKSMAKTSVNIGVLSNEGDELVGGALMRSNSNYLIKELERKAARLADCFGVQFDVLCRFGAWEYDAESSLVKQLTVLFEEHYGHAPEIMSTHGGMEPGVLIDQARSAGRKVEAMNMGVRSDGAHTTSEKMSITGVTEAYEWLKKILTGLD